MRPRFKTLGELRSDLAVSLGFGAMAGVIEPQVPILNQFLQQAQSQLWRDVNWRHLYKQHTEDLGRRQRVLDLPDDSPLGRLIGVFAFVRGAWRELRAGIPKSGEVAETGYPLWYEMTARYDGVEQIEFAPLPVDEVIPVRVEYYAAPSNFRNDDDRASIPDDILLTLAIVMAKGHYRQPDVQLYSDRFSKMLLSAKDMNFGVDGEITCLDRASYDPYALTPYNRY